MTISLPALSAVKTIITHANCPDGVASALVLRQVLNAEVKFMSYGTKEHDELPAEPGMLFCDFTPPASRAKEFVDASSIVLDHHRSAKDVVKMFGTYGVYSDEPGVCGAVLAYRYVWDPIMGLLSRYSEERRDLLMKDFVELIGIRDTFVRNHGRWNEACAMSEVLRELPANELLDHPRDFFTDASIIAMKELGRIFFKRKRENAKKLIDKAYNYSTMKSVNEERIRVGIVASTDTTDVADLWDEYPRDQVPDVVIGFSFYAEGATQKINLSLRSHSNFDCAAFCKYYGGGGHLRAAGCTLTLSYTSVQPYTFVRSRLEEYLER